MIRGHAKARAFWATFFEGWDEFRVEPTDLISCRDAVVAPLRWHARGRDGIEVEQTSVDLWTFRDSLVARIEGSETMAEALESAKLRA